MVFINQDESGQKTFYTVTAQEERDKKVQREKR
jgi:hypothetical protein